MRGAAHVGEERPGVLNRLLAGITALHLRGQTMACADVESPALRALTVIFHRTASLPGALRLPGHPVALSSKLKEEH